MEYYRCPVDGCGRVYTTITGLRRHYKNRHWNWCFVCNRRLSSCGAVTHHARHCIERNPDDQGHKALYALMVVLTQGRGCLIPRELYAQGLDAIDEIMGVR